MRIRLAGLFCALLLPRLLWATTYTVRPSGSTPPGDYPTIQACKNVAYAGDTCLIYEGTYPSGDMNIETVRGGTDNEHRITFKARGIVQIKHFRIKHPYITIQGFTFKGFTYADGVDNAAIRIEAAGDYAWILNNTIKDGVYLHSSAYTWDATARTVTCGDCTTTDNFVTRGFVANMGTYTANDINPPRPHNHDNNKGVTGIKADMVTHGYVDSGGVTTAKAQTMHDAYVACGNSTCINALIAAFEISAGFESYRSDTFYAIVYAVEWTVVFGDWSVFVPQAMIVSTVTANTLTFVAGTTVFSESGVQSVIYSNGGGYDKNGHWSVSMQLGSGSDVPNYCVIDGNIFDNIAGRILDLRGEATRVTHNTFTHTGGWRFFTISPGGNNTYIAYNVIKDAPRWPGFPAPIAFFASASTGTWDMYDVILASEYVGPNNLTFDHNFVITADTQFIRMSETPGQESTGFTLTNNVFVGVELEAGIMRPGTLIEHNTFYQSPTYSSNGQNFILGESYNQGNPGAAPGSWIKNNAFIEGGRDCLQAAPIGDIALCPTKGWYSTTGTHDNANYYRTPGVDADWDFVTGPGGAAKTTPRPEVPGDRGLWGGTMDGVTLEAHGINGGDAKLVNGPAFSDSQAVKTAKLLGADGIPFTNDDGLMPKADSPLCDQGENGTHIGAYACADVETSTIKRVCAAGSPTCAYSTIQACADAAITGMTCLVDAGTYAEYVLTKANGVTFQTNGLVYVKGFKVQHSDITIDGFDISGYLYEAMVWLTASANNCHILNNVVHDNGGTQTVGLRTDNTPGPDGCTIDHNTFRDMTYTFVSSGGSNHIFQNNEWQHNRGGQDYVRPMGTNITFRRNKFWKGIDVITTTGHPDAVQVWYSGPVDNILFEENFFGNLPISQAPCQMNIHPVPIDGTLWPQYVKNITYRRNLFWDMSQSCSWGVPYGTFENNTFYQAFKTGGAISLGGNMSRNYASHMTLKNNVFLGSGTTPDDNLAVNGYYSMGGSGTSVLAGAYIDEEPIRMIVTHETGPDDPHVMSTGIANDLFNKGYRNGNGYLLAPAWALNRGDIALFNLDPVYDAYKVDTFELLMDTKDMSTDMRATNVADYNYVASSPPSYYPKKSSSCTDSGFMGDNFCEALFGGHGRNGGDPYIRGNLRLGSGGLGKISGVSWVYSTKRLTKVGAFSSYTWTSEDRVDIQSVSQGSGDSCKYDVAAKISNDTIELGDGYCLTRMQSDTITDAVVYGITPASQVLGPDGIPFTEDDGLKPLPGSFLCTGGEGGNEMGVYSCDLDKVLPTSVRKPTNVIVH